MTVINGKRYKKTEPHLHLAPVSVCSQMQAEEAAQKLSKCGFEVAVLTNHYSRSYIDVRSATEEEWRQRYLESYRLFKEVASKYGLEVFLGTEVTLHATYIPCYRARWSEQFLKENYADYLLYGITEEFLRDTPFLCDLTFPELRAICDKFGALLVQAHPFRAEQGHSLKNIRLLDGIELNGNEGFPSGPHEEEVLRLARENNLVVTCGGDTHNTWDHLCSATYIPEEIHDSVALAAYLREVKIPHYSLNEPDPFTPSRKGNVK